MSTTLIVWLTAAHPTSFPWSLFFPLSRVRKEGAGRRKTHHQRQIVQSHCFNWFTTVAKGAVLFKFRIMIKSFADLSDNGQRKQLNFYCFVLIELLIFTLASYEPLQDTYHFWFILLFTSFSTASLTAVFTVTRLWVAFTWITWLNDIKFGLCLLFRNNLLTGANGRLLLWYCYTRNLNKTYTKHL